MSRERIINQTKQLLKDNLIRLLDKKPLSKITIKELCECADINRSTYYRYYLDQYDQLEKIEDEILIDMSSYIYSIIDKNKQEEISLIEEILLYIERHKYEFRVLMQKGDMEFQTKILSYVGKLIFKQIESRDLKKEVEYIYKAQGSFGIVREWIFGNIDLDVKTLTKYIVDMNRKY